MSFVHSDYEADRRYTRLRRYLLFVQTAPGDYNQHPNPHPEPSVVDYACLKVYLRNEVFACRREVVLETTGYLFKIATVDT